MKIFADASFLTSFCVRDTNARRAMEWWVENGLPMHTNRLAYFEVENAIRVLRVGGHITVEEEHSGMERLKRAVHEGFVTIWDISIKRLHPEARRISQGNSANRGFGAMDILHVASAKEMKCVAMLSFDRALCDLVAAEGLKALP